MLWEVGDLHAVRAVRILLTSPTLLVGKAAIPDSTRDRIVGADNVAIMIS